MRRRLSYANVTATLALFFAMSGGALAAKHYLINSTKQINPKVLRALRGNSGATGAPGTPGATGKEGPAGKDGKEGKEGKPGPVVLGEITEVDGPEVEVAKGKTGTSVAECAAGSRAVSGGYEFGVANTEAGPNLVANEASFGRKGWLVEISNPVGNAKSMFAFAIAYCAKEKVAVAP